MNLRETADLIIKEAIASAMPDEAVARALSGRSFPDGVILVSVGKAGWQMAKAASDILGDSIKKGIVVTKYDHVKGELPNIVCREAGHPNPDANSYSATAEALELVSGLTDKDTVVFLISGGGSALFESPLISEDEMGSVTSQLLACGADITEINTIRKRLSKVKGGRFAEACRPAKVFSIVLSDIIGDPLDMIASGPAAPDSSSTEDALKIVEKYSLSLSDKALACLRNPLPGKDELDNVETVITGSVKQLCSSAAATCERLGIAYEVLTDRLQCEAKDAGTELSALARAYKGARPFAYIEGGETVVKLTGKGLGGRNQEIALSAARGISGMENTAVFSVGSDGTDGPTDAAGGYADGDTEAVLSGLGIDIGNILADNDSYHALEKSWGLIITGPTGTNVNDLTVLLML